MFDVRVGDVVYVETQDERGNRATYRNAKVYSVEKGSMTLEYWGHDDKDRPTKQYDRVVMGAIREIRVKEPIEALVE